MPQRLFTQFFNGGTRAAVGSTEKFSIYNLAPFRKEFSEKTLGGASFIAMMPHKPIVAFVGVGKSSANSDRLVVLYDLEQRETLTEIHYDKPVRSLHMNEARLVVVSDTRINFYDLTNMLPLPQLTVQWKTPNVHGCLTKFRPRVSGLGTNDPPSAPTLGQKASASASGCYFAFPNSLETDGDIMVVDAMTCLSAVVIKAHRGTIAAMEANEDGTRLATCSTKGTLIRVWGIPSAQLLFTFRRGQREALIYSLAFNPRAGDLLACTSNSGTCHIFKLPNVLDGRSGVDHINGITSFAKRDVPKEQTLCGLDNGSLLILLQDGTLQRFTLNTATGKVEHAEEQFLS